jgi:glycosyltransferase involved in cell wall biosynthesis
VKKNILIISHRFPPAPGIGGRRWAKFAKYLTRNGNTVYILAAENIHPGSSEWMNDIKDLSVEYLPYKFPKILSIPVKNTWDKINYRLALLKVKMSDKGNYYDKSIFWEKQLQERVSYYIHHKSVDTVITTGAPFRMVYYVSALKNKFREITFVSDFRDLWTEDLEISAFSHLSSARREVEKNYEKLTVNNSDYVFTVSGSMRDYFLGLTDKNNCVVIPNGYDPDDLSITQASRNESENSEAKVRFVFAGTLYNNLDYILLPFFKAVKQLKEKCPDLYAHFGLEFYGKFPEEYKKYILDNQINDSISVLGEKTYPYVSAKVQSAHFGVLFLNDLYNFSFSTKFCEYMAQKKKIIVVSNEGETANFIIKNNLGFHINSARPYKDLVNAIRSVIEDGFKVKHNDHFDETFFSIIRISKELEKYLQKNI